MNEKKREICSIVGIVSLLIYIILTVVGTNEYLLTLRILFAGVAAVAYAIKMGIEISSEEKFGNSIFLIAICLFDILISAMNFMK